MIIPIMVAGLSERSDNIASIREKMEGETQGPALTEAAGSQSEKSGRNNIQKFQAQQRQKAKQEENQAAADEQRSQGMEHS